MLATATVTLRLAPMATTAMPRMLAHPTATMALIGLLEASFSAPARGFAVAFMGVASTVAAFTEAAGSTVGAATTADVAAPTDAALMRAVPMVAAPLAAVLSAAEFAADSQPTAAAGSTAAAVGGTREQYGISKAP